MKYTKEQKEKAALKAVEIMENVSITSTKSSSKLQSRIINELCLLYKEIEFLKGML